VCQAGRAEDIAVTKYCEGLDHFRSRHLLWCLGAMWYISSPLPSPLVQLCGLGWWPACLERAGERIDPLFRGVGWLVSTRIVVCGQAILSGLVVSMAASRVGNLSWFSSCSFPTYVAPPWSWLCLAIDPSALRGTVLHAAGTSTGQIAT